MIVLFSIRAASVFCCALTAAAAASPTLLRLRSEETARAVVMTFVLPFTSLPSSFIV